MLRTLLAPLGALALAFSSVGCASNDEPPFPVNELTPREWDPILAMAEDRGAVYVARATRLDRVDPATGVVTRVAGGEYAACPHDKKLRWAPTILDLQYPAFAVRDGVAYLSVTECGLWSWNIAESRATTLLRFSSDLRVPSMWGGVPGTAWDYYGMAFTVADDGLLVCLSVDPYRLELAEEQPRYQHRVEVWKTTREGKPVARLARVNDVTEFERTRCRQVVANGSEPFFVAGDALYKVKPLGSIAEHVEKVVGLHGEVDGVVQDDDYLYLIDSGEILRVRKRGSSFSETVLAQPKASEPARIQLATDGTFLYWSDAMTLRRMPKTGGEVETLVADRAWPGGLVASGGNAYFPWFEKVGARDVADAASGVELKAWTYDFSVGRVGLAR